MLRKEQRNSLRCGNQIIELSTPVVMGVVNATPDSFYSPSRVGSSLDFALEMAASMLHQGATILDIGGMSSRPGAKEIPAEEELKRVLPVVREIALAFPQAIISADTFRSDVAEACIGAGATMINDITGGQYDERMVSVIADTRAAYILMHMVGTPDTMQQNTEYQRFIPDLVKYFVDQLMPFHQAGIYDIVLDPGFGFAKTMEQNYQLIDQLGVFCLLEKPVMVGVSRKSTLSKTIGRPAEETLDATTALHMAALQNGASILRVHDVRPAMDAIAVYTQLAAAKTLENKRLKAV